MKTYKIPAAALALLLPVIACDSGTSSPGASLRSADEEAAVLDELGLEIDEETRARIDTVMAEDDDIEPFEPNLGLLEEVSIRAEELQTLEVRDRAQYQRAVELHAEIAELAVELNPNTEFVPYNGGGVPSAIIYCQLAGPFTDLVWSFTTGSELFAKLSHQSGGAAYSWVTWFMTIVARIDAEYAKDWAAQNIVANAPDVAQQLRNVADETDDVATFAALSYANDPNTFAEYVKDVSPDLASMARSTADIVEKCAF